MSKHRIFWKSSRRAYRVLIVLCVLALISGIVIFSVNDGFNGFPKEEKGGYTSKSDDAPVRYENTGSEENIDRIENGIHVRTGLVDAPGLRETVNNCTSCHSAKLVIQNRMSAERWHATIRWMQETQNLWPLGGKRRYHRQLFGHPLSTAEKGQKSGPDRCGVVRTERIDDPKSVNGVLRALLSSKYQRH